MMKNFLKLLVIFCLPIILAGAAIEILLRKIPNDYLYKKNYLDKNSAGIKILFLGNSHAFFGINPEYFTSTSFNASYVSQSFNYDFEILKQYKNKWDSLQYIVIPIDQPSIYGRLEKGSEAWRLKNYAIYYNINITHHITDNTELFNNNLKMTSARIKGFYLNHTSPITCSAKGWGMDYNSKNNKNLEETGKTAAQRYSGNDYGYLAENTASLKSIIEFAAAKKIKVILFPPPAYKSYIKNLNKVQLQQPMVLARQLCNTYPNTIYFNLLNDETFLPTDYYDADHVNEIGAKKLSLKLDSLISTAGNNKIAGLPVVTF